MLPDTTRQKQYHKQDIHWVKGERTHLMFNMPSDVKRAREGIRAWILSTVSVQFLPNAKGGEWSGYKTLGWRMVRVQNIGGKKPWQKKMSSTLLTLWVLIRNEIWMPLTLNWAPAGTWVSSAQQRMQPLCWHQLSSCCKRHDLLMAYQHTQTPSTMAARLSKVEVKKGKVEYTAEGHVKWNVT